MHLTVAAVPNNRHPNIPRGPVQNVSCLRRRTKAYIDQSSAANAYERIGTRIEMLERTKTQEREKKGFVLASRKVDGRPGSTGGCCALDHVSGLGLHTAPGQE